MVCLHVVQNNILHFKHTSLARLTPFEQRPTKRCVSTTATVCSSGMADGEINALIEMTAANKVFNGKKAKRALQARSATRYGAA